MPASYWDREASYRRRIGLLIPVVVVLVFSAFLVSGRVEYQEISRMVGWRGPMELLPEITIEPEVVEQPPEPRPQTEAKAEPAIDMSEHVAVEEGLEAFEPNPPRTDGGASLALPEPHIEPAPRPTEVAYSDTYVILHMVKPTYPPRELAAGIEGNVTVELVIDEHGRVASASVVSVLGPESFKESTLEAVREFRFQPPIEDGVPTSMRIRFLVKFRIFA